MTINQALKALQDAFMVPARPDDWFTMMDLSRQCGIAEATMRRKVETALRHGKMVARVFRPPGRAASRHYKFTDAHLQEALLTTGGRK
jgi:response regulator of citrate/malate metabolism